MAEQQGRRPEPDRTDDSHDRADPDRVSAATDRVPQERRSTVGGEGSIGVGEGIDDGGTHGGGTATAPTEEELQEECREHSARNADRTPA
jgi:hypothetical protein